MSHCDCDRAVLVKELRAQTPNADVYQAKLLRAAREALTSEHRRYLELQERYQELRDALRLGRQLHSEDHWDHFEACKIASGMSPAKVRDDPRRPDGDT
jgi:hypothetical protein